VLCVCPLTWLTVDQCCKYVTSGLVGEFVDGVQEDISVLHEIEKRCYQLAQSHYMEITVRERCCTVRFINLVGFCIDEAHYAKKW